MSRSCGRVGCSSAYVIQIVVVERPMLYFPDRSVDSFDRSLAGENYRSFYSTT